MYTSKTFEFHGKSYKIFCIDDGDPTNHTWYSFIDEQEIRNKFWSIKPGDNVLDIGAAFGSYTLTALAAGASYVWSFSPQAMPGILSEKSVLEQSLKLNGWQDKCRVFPTGVYDRSGYLDTCKQEFVDNITSFEIIKVEPLDDWAERELPPGTKINWIKFDVEGAEVHAIRSGKNLIKKMLPNIMVENHLFVDSNIAQEVKNLILSLGPYREVATVPYHSVSHSLYSVTK